MGLQRVLYDPDVHNDFHHPIIESDKGKILPELTRLKSSDNLYVPLPVTLKVLHFAHREC
jgi:hypothetical protein